jgi:hypothetical protein
MFKYLCKELRSDDEIKLPEIPEILKPLMLFVGMMIRFLSL